MQNGYYNQFMIIHQDLVKMSKTSFFLGVQMQTLIFMGCKIIQQTISSGIKNTMCKKYDAKILTLEWLGLYLISQRLSHEEISTLNHRRDQKIEIRPRKIIKQQCSLPQVRCIEGGASFPCTTSPLPKLSQTIGS